MRPFEEIHCLDDFGMIAGSYKVMYIDCVTAEGESVDLSAATGFGCRFLYYGTTTQAFAVSGEAVSDVPGRMKITLPSTLTYGMGDTCLEYIPYVVLNGQTIKYGKGRLIIEGDAE